MSVFVKMAPMFRRNPALPFLVLLFLALCFVMGLMMLLLIVRVAAVM